MGDDTRRAYRVQLARELFISIDFYQYHGMPVPLILDQAMLELQARLTNDEYVEANDEADAVYHYRQVNE